MLKFYSILLLLISQHTQNLQAESVSHLGLYEKQVVRIMVDRQRPNDALPFTAGLRQSSSGSGLLLSPRLILTNAHVVANERFLRVGRHGEDQLKIAKLKFHADDLDIALIEIDANEADYQNVSPVKWGDIPKQLSTVQAVGFPAGGEQLSITSGVVSRIEMYNYVHSLVDNHLLIQVDAPINPGNSGGPVFSADRVVGLSVQGMQNLQNTGFIIPVPIIKKFLKDIEDGSYDGSSRDEFIGTLGQSLENPRIREFFKFNESKGIVVSDIPDNTFLKGILEPGDILLKINGHDIGFDGKIKIHDQRIDFSFLFDLMQPEEKFTVQIFRNEKTEEFTVTLPKRKAEEFPPVSYQKEPEYFIYGGIVLTTITGNSLRNLFRSSKPAPILLQYLAQYKFQDPQLNPQPMFAMITSVLSNPDNRRASDFVNDIIVSVNGKSYKSLKELQDLLNEDSDTHIIKFFKRDASLIVDHQAMLKNNESIKSRHKIEKTEFFHD